MPLSSLYYLDVYVFNKPTSDAFISLQIFVFVKKHNNLEMPSSG